MSTKVITKTSRPAKTERRDARIERALNQASAFAEKLTAINLHAIRSPTSTKSTSTDRTITEIPIESDLEDVDAAAILMQMRGESKYTPAEWIAAIALIKLSMDEVVHTPSPARGIPAISVSPASSVTLRGRSLSSASTISLGDETPASADSARSSMTPGRRVTRRMGEKAVPMAAYDMSYHPIDDVIRVRVRARNGRKNV